MHWIISIFTSPTFGASGFGLWLWQPKRHTGYYYSSVLVAHFGYTHFSGAEPLFGIILNVYRINQLSFHTLILLLACTIHTSHGVILFCFAPYSCFCSLLVSLQYRKQVGVVAFGVP